MLKKGSLVSEAKWLLGTLRGKPILLLLVGLVLMLASCGGGGGTSSSGGGGGGEETTSTEAAASRTVELTPSGNSGVSGTATLSDTTSGVEVQLTFRHIMEPPGIEHLAHIHEGATCEDDRAGNGAPVLYPLTPVRIEQNMGASSTTTLEGVTVDQLFSGTSPKYINVHAQQSGEEVPPGISCADLS